MNAVNMVTTASDADSITRIYGNVRKKHKISELSNGHGTIDIGDFFPSNRLSYAGVIAIQRDMPGLCVRKRLCMCVIVYHGELKVYYNQCLTVEGKALYTWQWDSNRFIANRGDNFSGG